LRRITLSHLGAPIIGRLFNDTLAKYRANAIGGPIIGADPIVGATLALTPYCVNGFLVRDKIKDHGTTILIEGPLNSNDAALIVDDVATSGGSLLKAIHVVQSKCNVVGAMVILDRLEGAKERLAKEGIELTSLLTINDLEINN
jgi:orotate phosphoribosyltransferase